MKQKSTRSKSKDDDSPNPTDISSYFKLKPSKLIKSQYQSAPHSTTAQAPQRRTPTNKKLVKKDDKGKGKQVEVLEISDDDDDDDVQILEYSPPNKKLKLDRDSPLVARDRVEMKGVKEDEPLEEEKKAVSPGIELELGDPEGTVHIEAEETRSSPSPLLDEDEDSQAIIRLAEEEEEAWESRSEPYEGDPLDEEDVWGEERMEIEQDEEGEDIIVQGSSRDLEERDQEHKCPVCEKVLEIEDEKKRELHINSCLNSDPKPSTSTDAGFFSRFSLFRPSKPTATTTTATPKPVRPLSQLPSFSSPPTDPTLPNAFTALMTSHVLSSQWKEAEKSDNTKGRLPRGEKRAVPFYKWVEGMEITVDAFKYGKIEGCKAYFLSHAHADHYQNLSKSWTGGPIYCSLTTANLIKLKLQVPDQYIKVLPMNTTVDVFGIKVTLIDANHCPGSVIFLFEGPYTDKKSPWSKTPKRIFRHLHCGDFRASPAHLNHPALKDKKIDIVYLDTTYLDAKYCFPSQELVIKACAELVKERIVDGDVNALGRTGGDEMLKQEKLMKGWLVKKEEEEGKVPKEEEDEKVREKEKLLVLIGTYSIGKERIVKGVAQALNTKIYADAYKRPLFDAQDDPVLHALLTKDPLEAQVHVCSLRDINHDGLSTYLSQYRKQGAGFTKCIGLRPTGWTYRPETKGEKMPTIAKILEREMMRKFSAAGMYPQRDSTSMCMAYGVPYSEHSSFFELTCFALSLNLVRIIPTVNVHTATSRAKMQDWVNRWSAERKRRADAGLPRMVPYRNENYW